MDVNKSVAEDSSSTSKQTMQEIIEEKRNYFHEQYNSDKKSLPFPAFHFNFVRKLSKGSFGRVDLVRDSTTRELFALKRITKKLVNRKKCLGLMVNERRIHGSLDHPFIVGMKQHYKNKKFLYLLMEFCPGKDFFKFLIDIDILSEDETRFYTSQVILALEFMHGLGLIYRDLKPENIMLCADGYVKLTDMGFAKKIREGTTSFNCTLEYCAPELMSNGVDRRLLLEYNQSVDWWSFGVLVYEILVGSTPYQIRNKSMHYYGTPISYPKHLSEKAKDLLQGLLRVDVHNRIGCQGGGASEVKGQAFFSSVDWERLFFKQAEAPYAPGLVEEPTSEFDFYSSDESEWSDDSSDNESEEEEEEDDEFKFF